MKQRILESTVGATLVAALLLIAAAHTPAARAQGAVVTDGNGTTVAAPADSTTKVHTNADGDTVITVTVGSDPVTFEANARPRMIGGRVMVPLRGVVEKLGGTIKYDAASHVITGGHGDTGSQFRLRLGSNQALVNGKDATLDAAPRAFGGVTYVPLRFVSEALGAHVSWDNAKHSVLIEAGGDAAEVKPAG